MKKQRTLRHVIVALTLLVAMLCQGTWALAGTTGALNGTVTDEKGQPVAQAAVHVDSPSQQADTTTDNAGHFGFLSLAPDSYTISVAKSGYQKVSLGGATVFADQQQAYNLSMPHSLKEIANVTSRSASSLVKSGTTADVYSVSEADQQASASSGGGYNLNSAYSAVYNQPGVQGQIGNYGIGQVFYIRGSAYSQVGYEFDGIPVNRAFDNYNANSLSNLGQQELQVYTGGSPAGSSSATLGGFINQVIKTGTYPGSAYLSAGIGAPTFYHALKGEAGGATPNRLFSYYVGVGSYNQAYHFQNNQDSGNFASNGNNSIGISGVANTLNAAGFLTTTGRAASPACNPDGSAPAGSEAIGGPVGVGLPNCLAFLPTQTSVNQNSPFVIQDRENVANFHFGIPHKHDSGRDDVQLLYDNFSVPQYFAQDFFTYGGFANINAFLAPTAAVASAFGIPAPPPGSTPYPNICQATSLFATQGPAGPGGTFCASTSGTSPIPYGDVNTFAAGTTFGQLASTATTVPYLFPFTPKHVQYAGLPVNAPHDEIINNGSILKLQYQKNFGSNAYARVYGYTFYSDWLQSGAFQGGISNYLIAGPTSLASNDYELNTHTRGAELQLADQINAKNLLNLTANYTTASVVRWNNFTPYQGSAFLANSYAPNRPTTFTNLGTSQCYSFRDNPGTGAVLGAPASCFTSDASGTYQSPTRGFAGGDPCAASPAFAGTQACAAGAKFYVTAPAEWGYRNTVRPAFTSLALTDEWRPTDRLNVNLGIRNENYQYNLENTNTPANQYWFKAAANEFCYWSISGQPVQTAITPTNPVQTPITSLNNPAAFPGQTNPGACYSNAAGTAQTNTQLTDPTQGVALHPNGVGGNRLYSANGVNTITKNLWSPRIGATYTLNPDTVLRASYGRYTQPTETAFEQYTGPSGQYIAKNDFSHFWGIGFTTPVHDNPVQVSNNYDFSIEKHLKGTDISIKLSPYYRYTTNQLISVSLGGNFASGINAATQKSTGIELAIHKGDSARNGFSGELALTLSQAKQKYATLSNGSNAIANINTYIKAFNSLTSGGGGAPCYATIDPATGTPYLAENLPNAPVTGAAATAGCTQAGAAAAGNIINPYYGNAIQSTLDPNGWYEAYPNNPPGSVGATDFTQNVPFQVTGFLNWKKNRLTLNTSFTLQAGNRYGAPLDFLGNDPRLCGSNQANSGNAPGTDTPGAADFQTCGSTTSTPSGNLAVVNPATGMMTGMGQYKNPWQFNLGGQIGYEMSSRLKLTLVMANIINKCFGGDTPKGSLYSPGTIVCGWGDNGLNIGGPNGAGYFYGSTPTNVANGTAGYLPWLNQSYMPAYNGLPFQAYLNIQFKI